MEWNMEQSRSLTTTADKSPHYVEIVRRGCLGEMHERWLITL